MKFLAPNHCAHAPTTPTYGLLSKKRTCSSKRVLRDMSSWSNMARYSPVAKSINLLRDLEMPIFVLF